MVGLSQEEKKSSPPSEGVDVPSAGVEMAMSLTTSSGNLCVVNPRTGSCLQFLHILFGVGSSSLLELIFVFGCSVRRILRLRVFASECSGSTMGLEILGGRLVAPHLHGSELIPLPF